MENGLSFILSISLDKARELQLQRSRFTCAQKLTYS